MRPRLRHFRENEIWVKFHLFNIENSFNSQLHGIAVVQSLLYWIDEVTKQRSWINRSIILIIRTGVLRSHLAGNGCLRILRSDYRRSQVFRWFAFMYQTIIWQWMHWRMMHLFVCLKHASMLDVLKLWSRSKARAVTYSVETTITIISVGMLWLEYWKHMLQHCLRKLAN